MSKRGDDNLVHYISLAPPLLSQTDFLSLDEIMLVFQLLVKKYSDLADRRIQKKINLLL